MAYIIKPDVRNSNKPIHRTILGIIVDERRPEINNRIQMGAYYTNPIPEGSAKEGQRKGSWKSISCYPGIPTKKFTDQDEAIHGGTHEWTVQNFYQAKKLPGETKSPMATYVGWNSSAIFIENSSKFLKDYPAIVESSKIRDEFLKVIKRDHNSTEEMKMAADRYLEMSMELAKDVDHLFWEYEDLTYYHSKIQLDYGLAPVYYVYLRESMWNPPSFQYTTFNIIDEGVFDELANKYQAKMEELGKKGAEGQHRRGHNTCEKPDTCKCNQVYFHLYNTPETTLPPPINIHPDTLPHLPNILTNFSSDHPRIIIECSDACQCSSNCARRRFQQGQTKRLVVYFENDEVMFGLRAAEEIKKREFICEYTGHVRKLEEGESMELKKKIKTMEKGIVIDASEIGNIARFVNTSTTPSALLIETHSRTFESDPLTPRISIYALKDIAIGDPITIGV